MRLVPRVIPITITASLLVLGLRLGDLWQSGAHAQQPAPPPARTAAPAPAPAPPPAAPASAPPRIVDEGGFSSAELDVLQGLMARREALDQRGTELDRREALLTAAEGRINSKVQELKQLQATLETTMRRYDEQEDARQKSLIKMFETMKPKDAARIFEQMEVPTLVQLVEHMREAKAAPILAELTPTRAKQIAAELAKRRPPVTGG